MSAIKKKTGLLSIVFSTFLPSFPSYGETSPKSMAGKIISCHSENNSDNIKFIVATAVTTSEWSLDQWYQAKTLSSSGSIFYVFISRLSKYPRRAAGLEFKAAYGSTDIDYVELEDVTYTTTPNRIPLGFRGQITKSRYSGRDRKVVEVTCAYEE